MRLVELIIDGDDMELGIDAISLVDKPAIEKNFIALKSQDKFQFKSVDEDKRILLGPALIPDLPIYRRKGEEEYHVYFSKQTVRKASELYLRRHKNNNHTLQHEIGIEGVYLAESWIVDSKNDKSQDFDIDVPRGTWMVSLKVENDEIWNEYVKTGRVKGFSIEGNFFDKANTNMAKEDITKKDYAKWRVAQNKIQEFLYKAKKELEKNDYAEDVAGAMFRDTKRFIERAYDNATDIGIKIGETVRENEKEGGTQMTAVLAEIEHAIKKAITK